MVNNTETGLSSIIEAEILGNNDDITQEAPNFIGDGTPNSPAYATQGFINETGTLAVQRAEELKRDFYFTVEGNLFRASPDGTIQEPERMEAAVRANERRNDIYTLLNMDLNNK